MASQADRAHVRLAELVAALSIGIDLGFLRLQPYLTERMLRQSGRSGRSRGPLSSTASAWKGWAIRARPARRNGTKLIV